MPVEIKNLDGEVIFIYQGENLVEANLGFQNLPRADFKNQDMRNINLENAYCRGADFSGANMSGQKTCLVYARCHEAKFIRTNLEGADMERMNVFDADLTGAILKNTRRLGIRHNENTRWPDET